MENFETVEVTTDLLILGGGMAACGAAVEAAYWAKMNGLKVTIVDKAAMDRSGAVAMGLMVLGVASFAFLSLSGRALGPAAFAPLATLWVVVNAAGPAFFQPLEQELGRAVAHAAAQDDPAARPRRSRRPVPPALGEIAERLSDRFDTRVKVDMGRAKGKVTIEFASMDDLERIVQVLDAPPA